MKHKSALKNRLLLTPILTLCLTLTSVSVGVAQSNVSAPSEGEKACSNRTISGDYGVQIEGTILGPNLTLRTLVMQHFDGVGNLTEVDHVVLGGQPPAEEWRPTTGIYSVNPNCTGSVSIDVGPGNPPLNYHFVVVDSGRQFLLVVDRGAIRGVGYRVD